MATRKKKEEVVIEETKEIYVVKTKMGGPLNVRKEPEGDIVTTIQNGFEIEVLEIADGWCRLKNGYVLEELVVKKEE